jgi:single-stranded-DNA-specific exonuclease
MKVTLLTNEYNSRNTLEYILENRGLPQDQLYSYINSSSADINSPLALGEEQLYRGAVILAGSIQNDDRALVVVDADADGFTSAAIFLNWLYDFAPAYVTNKVDYFLHDEKSHGLSDCIDLTMKYKLVICPDSSSNDFDEHRQLAEADINVLVLDHHHAEVDPAVYDNACIINNQLCDYPNKELSGAGVVWQFCRYLDSKLDTHYADNYLDLAAVGLDSDMMSMLSTETKQIIFEGFKERNIKNPFLYSMIEKNEFVLSKGDYKASRENGLLITPMGCAFFITPLINAIVRSGTQEEKDIVFRSMLKYEAFKEIPSTKRGHKLGEKEQTVTQALRVCTNVKNRQTRAQDEAVALLESLIEERHLLDHKVLLFLLDAGAVEKGILGLVANKFMAKYQRPTLMLTKTINKETGEIFYQGSGRGYGKEMDFRQICEDAGAAYAQGHAGAFGCSLAASAVNDFLIKTDEILKDLSSEPSYFVDYIWDMNTIEPEKILEIAEMNDYWGKDLDRSLVCIENLIISKNNFKVMKSNTLKYEFPQVDIIQFAGSEEEIEKFTDGNIYIIRAVCKCCENEWNFQINPQLQMVDYEIIKEEAPTVIEGWNF